MYQYKNMLVTGSAGFIGSCFVRMMLGKYVDLKIVSLDKLTYSGNMHNLDSLPNHHNHTFIQGDILNDQLVSHILREYQIDTIVHFAAESHVDNSILNPKAFVETNVMGTFVLLECARQYWLTEKKWDENQCRFHHVSTDEVYGSLHSDDPAFTETTPYAPNSPYSASKAGSDHVVRAYFHTYQLPVTTSHCSNNYGPYQHSEKFIPVVIQSCLIGKKIPIYGNGTNIRDWLYVEDHCDAIDSILKMGRLGESYNIGGKNELDNLSLVSLITDIMDELHPENAPHSQLISFVKDRKGHDKRYAIDNQKIQTELTWQPKTEFKTALTETIIFYINAMRMELV
jgi:dTDP-glucose 4,6-dehydratase